MMMKLTTVVAAAVTLTALLLGSATAGAKTRLLPRTITLDGEEFGREDVDTVKSWECGDWPSGGATRVEVGLFPDLNLADVLKDTEPDAPGLEEIKAAELSMGFVLYDGGNEGTTALYYRQGLNHEWVWGPDNAFKIRIKTDGTAGYYDFTGADEGELRTPETTFSCERVTYRPSKLARQLPNPQPAEFHADLTDENDKQDEVREEPRKSRPVNPKLRRSRRSE